MKQNKPKNQADGYIVQALDILVPNQSSKYQSDATGVLEQWEAVCEDSDKGRKAITMITKNGKAIYQSTYNYNTGKYTKRWL